MKVFELFWTLLKLMCHLQIVADIMSPPTFLEILSYIYFVNDVLQQIILLIISTSKVCSPLGSHLYGGN